MGAFDFTYSVPANFNKRVVQFLQQFGKAHVAQAFQRCECQFRGFRIFLEKIFRSCAAIQLPASNKEIVLCAALSKCGHSGSDANPHTRWV